LKQKKKSKFLKTPVETLRITYITTKKQDCEKRTPETVPQLSKPSKPVNREAAILPKWRL
jgi:hypothetical protein